MAVANEFLMDKLKFICSVVLRRCINLSNVTSIAIEAEFYRADSLKETCMDFILSNLDKLQSKKFPISRSRSAVAVNQDERVSRGSIQSNCPSSTSPPSDLLPTRIQSDPTSLDSSYSTTSNGTPAKTLEPVNETVDEEEDVQFAMDDFDEAEEVGKGKQQQRGLGDFSSSPRLPSDLMSPNQNSPNERRGGNQLKPLNQNQTPRPAWRSISNGNDRSSSTTPLSSSPSSSKLPIQKLHAKAGVVPTPKIPEPIADPASAVGATVITPTRASNGIASSNSSRRTVAGQDRPWTNYLSTTSAPLNPSTHPTVSIPILSPSFLVDQSLNHLSPGTSLDTITTTNFSIIQERQAKESYLLFGPGKLKPQLAQIQEDEQRRLIEKKQEEDFLKWFEDESARLQQQQQQAHSSRSNTKLKSKNPIIMLGRIFTLLIVLQIVNLPRKINIQIMINLWILILRGIHIPLLLFMFNPLGLPYHHHSLVFLLFYYYFKTESENSEWGDQGFSFSSDDFFGSSSSLLPCTHKSTLLHRQQQQQQKQQNDLLRPSLSVKSSTVHSHNPSSSSSSSSSTVKAN
ncbi:hypothetical protein H4Q26_000272 [Puccinia striiformis f. sp. tritici PST-130]|nr:hypothetical protein H4Q26_000272 [Puccinia striiformis f. sp. tritici PST-130]